MDKIDYKPVEKTGVLSSSVYEDGTVLTFGAKTHMSLIKDSEHKFAAFQVIKATDKEGNPCLLQEQECEDGKFAVFAISALKTKKVFSTDNANSVRRLSGGMSISEILALEPNKEYRLTKTTADGFKKPFGWVEGEALVANNSYRLEAVQSPQPTTKK